MNIVKLFAKNWIEKNEIVDFTIQQRIIEFANEIDKMLTKASNEDEKE